MSDAVKSANKNELAEKLASASGLEKEAALQFLNSLGAVCVSELKRAELVVLPGVGRIKVIHKPATEAGTGVHPFTKQPMEIKAKPASRSLKASLAKPLKDALA